MNLVGQKPNLEKLIFQLQYRQGHAYLDVCGRTINKIQRDFPSYLYVDATPSSCTLRDSEHDIVLTYNSSQLSLSVECPANQIGLDKSIVADFAQAVGMLSDVITESLNVQDFSRVGFRQIYNVPYSEKRDAVKWLSDLGMIEFSNVVKDNFNIESFGWSIVDRGGEMGPNSFRKYYLSVTERQWSLDIGTAILSIQASKLDRKQREHLLRQRKVKEQLKTQLPFAARLDIDSYIEEPLWQDTFEQFVLKSYSHCIQKMQSTVGVERHVH